VRSGIPELVTLLGQSFTKGVLSTAQASDYTGKRAEIGSEQHVSALGSTCKDLLIYYSWSIEKIFKYPWVLVEKLKIRINPICERTQNSIK
jgi:hypothetical protein